ncbi:cation-efflux pump [candidate division KSB1 bacterium]
MATQNENNLIDLSQGIKVTVVCLVGNVLLTALKLVFGIIGNSRALVADALHSSADMASSVLVLVGLKIAARPRDEDHPYGHGRIESLVSLVLGLGLIIVAVIIFVGALRSIISGRMETPGTIALIGAALSVAVKEAMFRYTIVVGNRLESPSVIASAWEHRSDAYSSIGVVVGIAGARFGFPILDPLAACIVSGFILKAGITIAIQAFNELMDRALPDQILERMNRAVRDVPGVRKVTGLRGRKLGTGIVADVAVLIDGLASAREGHGITRLVDDALKKCCPNLIETIIHVDADVLSGEQEMGRFKNKTKEIIENHDDLYLEVHKLDFHLSPEGREVHFHLVVPAGTDFEKAHEASQHLEDDIKREFPQADVVVHLEPASEALSNRRKRESRQ